MTATRSKLTLFTETLDLIRQNAQILIDAEEEGSIQFDDQVVPAAFHIISDITGKAAQMNANELEAFSGHLREDGPILLQKMIEDMLHNSPPVMSRSYLEGKLIKAPSAIQKDERARQQF